MKNVEIKKEGDVERIYMDNVLEGTIKRTKEGWQYENCIGKTGLADTRTAAFLHLGFKFVEGSP